MPTTKRPRGAPPGNTNALKHGFHSRQFRQAEINDLDIMLTNSLESEINMLRVVTRRVLELSQDNDDIETGIKLLATLGATTTRLASLLRTQTILGGGGQDDVYDQITRALAQVNKELFKP
jgi:hypothetical protein